MALCKYNPNNVLFSLFCLFAFVSLYPSVPSESDIPALSSHVRIRAHADLKSISEMVQYQKSYSSPTSRTWLTRHR